MCLCHSLLVFSFLLHVSNNESFLTCQVAALLYQWSQTRLWHRVASSQRSSSRAASLGTLADFLPPPFAVLACKPHKNSCQAFGTWERALRHCLQMGQCSCNKEMGQHQMEKEEVHCSLGCVFDAHILHIVWLVGVLNWCSKKRWHLRSRREAIAVLCLIYSRQRCKS